MSPKGRGYVFFWGNHPFSTPRRLQEHHSVRYSCSTLRVDILFGSNALCNRTSSNSPPPSVIWYITKTWNLRLRILPLLSAIEMSSRAMYVLFSGIHLEVCGFVVLTGAHPPEGKAALAFAEEALNKEIPTFPRNRRLRFMSPVFRLQGCCRCMFIFLIRVRLFPL